MFKSRMVRGAFLSIAAACLCAGAQAQLFRAYLTSDGSDASPCTLQAPCRLLPAALNAVADGGEVWMLDSANYNTATVTVNKSVSILAVPGVVGSLVANNGGPAILISADGLNVSLRNLVIGPQAGAAAGTHGVSVTGASNLTIEDSLIQGVPNAGILVGSDSGVATAKITNTVLRNIGQWAINASRGARVSVARVDMLNTNLGGVGGGNGGGALARGDVAGRTTILNITDSRVANNGTATAAEGVRVRGSSGGTVVASVTRTTIEGSYHALYSEDSDGASPSVLNVSGSMIVTNNNAWYQKGTLGFIYSLGNNHFANNTGSFGTLTSLAPQ